MCVSFSHTFWFEVRKIQPSQSGMLKSELGHLVLMRWEAKPAQESQARTSLAHKEPRKDWQRVGKLSTSLQ